MMSCSGPVCQTWQIEDTYASVASVCTEYTAAKRRILEQKLLLTAHRKSHMRNRLVPKMKDLDLCLEVVSRSRDQEIYLATIGNYYIACCEAVWSAILVTAWLLE